MHCINPRTGEYLMALGFEGMMVKEEKPAVSSTPAAAPAAPAPAVKP